MLLVVFLLIICTCAVGLRVSVRVSVTAVSCCTLRRHMLVYTLSKQFLRRRPLGSRETYLRLEDQFVSLQSQRLICACIQ